MPVRDIKSALPSEKLKKIALNNGASACGVIEARSVHTSSFENAVQNYPQSLSYLKKDPALRKDIRRWFLEARSVVICLYQYWHENMNYEKTLSDIKDASEYLKNTGRKISCSLDSVASGRISRYALSRDYHLVVRESLMKILDKIKDCFSGVRGKIFVDTSPVIEKEQARLAGLGHIGKNTLLLNRKLGSYVFIGGIALNFQAWPYDIPTGESCLSCDRCIKACPTGALSEKGLTPLRCISYWTTTWKSGEMPQEIRLNSMGWIYGCDICQEVCPLNSKTRYSVMKELLPVIENPGFCGKIY